MPVYHDYEPAQFRAHDKTDLFAGPFDRQNKSLGGLLSKRPARWKRLIDIAGSLAGLVCLWPLLLIIAAYIKAVSPGPVFFWQARVGRGGKSFECIKFRTMKPDADVSRHKTYLADLINGGGQASDGQQKMIKLHDDPQIIPFGNVLREMGLDELPQLFNVLRGEMSLVGPRPPIAYEVEQYKLWYKDRFDVTPGLTGLWQISGKNRLTFNEMIRLDIQYARNVSFWLDMKILICTPYAVYTQVKDYILRKRRAPKTSSMHTA